MKDIMWCYFGENNDQVMMTCSKEDWENICKALELVSKGKVLLHSESDEWNYSYTSLYDRRIHR